MHIILHKHINFRQMLLYEVCFLNTKVFAYIETHAKQRGRGKKPDINE